MPTIRYVNPAESFSAKIEVEEGTTVAQFLASRNIDVEGSYNVRLNGETPSREDVLKENDRIGLTVKKIVGA